MKKDGDKLVLISLSVACFILLWATVSFYVMEEGERGKKNVLQKKLGEVTGVRQDVEAKLKESEMLNVELKTRLKTQEETIATMTSRVEEEKAANTGAMLKLQERESDIRAMKKGLENEIAQKESVLKKIEAVSEENAGLKAQLDDLARTKEDAERKAKETAEKEGVSLGTVVVAR